MNERIALRCFALALVAVVIGGCERAKTKLDREVDRLCAIDGGVKIYEKVKLSAENFGPNEELFPQYRHLVSKGGHLGPHYSWEFKVLELVSGEPKLLKWTEQIRVNSSNKVLAQQTYYSRVGGDFPGPWAPSTYSCTNFQKTDIAKEVFVKVGEEK